MDNYICKACGEPFETYAVESPHCPTCYSSKVVRMSVEHRLSEYRQYGYMRIRLRRWDVRIQRLYDGGYIPQAVYDAYHELTSIWFFDWYHIALPARAASLHPGVYEPYTLVCLRFAPYSPGE